MNTPYLQRFRELRVTVDSDPHSLGDDRLQVLWCFSVVKDDADLAYLTPAQASEILRELEGIHVSRQRANGILTKERGTVSRKRIRGKPHFKIMKSGEDALNAVEQMSVFVDPASALSEIRRMEDVLSKLKGTLKICDPYIDNKTLDFLAECRSAAELRLLTVNAYEKTKLRRDLEAFRKQHSAPIEIRVAGGSPLHDRYIVHQEGMLLLGGSLNGFAKKQTFVVNLGTDIRAASEHAFDAAWAKSPAF